MNTQHSRLEQKEAHSPAEAKAIARFYLCQFYCIPPESLTIEQVLEDREGRQRGEILNLEAQLFSTVAVDRSVKALERQMAWNQGLCPWDISGMALRRELRHKLGLNRYFDVEREWDATDLEAIAHTARECQTHQEDIEFHDSAGIANERETCDVGCPDCPSALEPNGH